MSHIQDSAVDVVELAPYVPPAGAIAPLREVAFRSNIWLPEEIEQLREMFAADVAVQDMAIALRRPVAGVVNKFWELGLRRRSARPWNELEDQVLVQRYGADAAASIAQDLGRSAASIYVRAKLLGLSEPNEPPWTPWEDAQLQAGYDAGLMVRDVAALIGRTPSATNSRAYKLGIRHPDHPEGWSSEELGRALALAEEGHRYLKICEQLAGEGFPRRTKAGLQPKLWKLGYRRGWSRPWTPEEEAALIAAYRDNASLTPLKVALGRTSGAFRWKAEELGLQGTHARRDGFRQGPAWTPAEDAILRARYATDRAKDIARDLGKPLGGIYNRAWILKLKNPWCRDFSADEDHAIAIAWRKGVGLTDLALAFGRDQAVVSKHAIRLGFSFSDPARPMKPSRKPRKSRPVYDTIASVLALEGASPAEMEARPTPGRNSQTGIAGDAA
jgi:hypothetical protein